MRQNLLLVAVPGTRMRKYLPSWVVPAQADSSASPLPHLEAKIQQTHSLARLLTKYAEQLLQEYVSGIGGCEYQGPGKWGSP